MPASAALYSTRAMDNNENAAERYRYCAACAKLTSIAKRFASREFLEPFLYGQGLSVLICGTAVTSTYLVTEYDGNIPLAQSFCNYVLLVLVYGTLFALQKDQDGHSIFYQALKTVGWKYFLVAVADVLANFLIVSAYQYTSLTSVQVLDCFVIPVVMILSWLILKACYAIVHFIGVAMALIGVTIMIVADVTVGRSEGGSNPVLGDIMVLAGATCYAISNVGMEYFMKTRTAGNLEVLAMYGLFGSVLSGTMMAILERDALINVKWSLPAVGMLLGFTLCMFLLYSLMPIVMKLSTATTVNLSILTADLYALFVGIFLFGYQFTPLYIVSFVVIFLSLIVYNSRPPLTIAGELEENHPDGSCCTNCTYLSGSREGSPNTETSGSGQTEGPEENCPNGSCVASYRYLAASQEGSSIVPTSESGQSE